MTARISAIALCLFLVSCTSTPPSASQSAKSGKAIAFSREKGNCLACHEISGGEAPGNLGPPLNNLPSRFKSRQELREQIWDATRLNPETSMPPFGRNKILSEHEIDEVVEFLWEL